MDPRTSGLGRSQVATCERDPSSAAPETTEQSTVTVRVIIVDDMRLYREALAGLLGREAWIQSVESATDADEALACLDVPSPVAGTIVSLALAIGAGVDILTIADQTGSGLVERTIDIIAAHVKNGAISEARIDASYARISALKARLLGA